TTIAVLFHSRVRDARLGARSGPHRIGADAGPQRLATARARAQPAKRAPHRAACGSADRLTILAAIARAVDGPTTRAVSPLTIASPTSPSAPLRTAGEPCKIGRVSPHHSPRYR